MAEAHMIEIEAGRSLLSQLFLQKQRSENPRTAEVCGRLKIQGLWDELFEVPASGGECIFLTRGQSLDSRYAVGVFNVDPKP